MILRQLPQRMVQMVGTGRMLSVDGVEIAVSARSICVHGDTPGAVAMAVAVRRALSEAGIEDAGVRVVTEQPTLLSCGEHAVLVEVGRAG